MRYSFNRDVLEQKIAFFVQDDHHLRPALYQEDSVFIQDHQILSVLDVVLKREITDHHELEGKDESMSLYELLDERQTIVFIGLDKDLLK